MLAIRNASKQFGETIHALRDVSLDVARGEVVALLGPSGCGKTTLLRIVAGLESMDAGTITLEGSDLTRIPIHRRNFGFMFQDFALFPHQSVAENIAFGLRMRHEKSAAIQTRIEEMLALVNLPGYGTRSIFELSGGERQRVALARSLAPNPRLLMLDEPLGSLDRNLRESLALELRAILREVGVTAIYVTHDQQEALVMSDRVAIMRQGQIEQIASPEQVYRRPATEFVARFLGFRNLIPIEAVLADGRLQTPIGMIPIPSAGASGIADADGSLPPVADPSATLLIRPESARFITQPAPNQAPPRSTGAPTAPAANDAGQSQSRITVRGILSSCVFLGIEYRITVDIPGPAPDHAAFYRLHFDLPSHQMDLNSGRLLPVSLPPVGTEIGLFLFPDLMSIVPGSQI